MAKKKHSKKQEANGKAESKPIKSVSLEDEKVFDFGGLPQRDLKKNLGCG